MALPAGSAAVLFEDKEASTRLRGINPGRIRAIPKEIKASNGILSSTPQRMTLRVGGKAEFLQMLIFTTFNPVLLTHVEAPQKQNSK